MILILLSDYLIKKGQYQTPDLEDQYTIIINNKFVQDETTQLL